MNFILYEVSNGNYDNKRQIGTSETKEEASRRCLNMNKASAMMNQQVGYIYETVKKEKVQLQS